MAIKSTIFEVIGIKNLASLKWKGDDKAEAFFTEFMRRYNTMLRTCGPNALTDNQVRDILYQELIKSSGPNSFELDLRDWEKTYSKSERTFVNLRDAFKEWIERRRIRANQQKSIAQEEKGEQSGRQRYTRKERREWKLHQLQSQGGQDGDTKGSPKGKPPGSKGSKGDKKGKPTGGGAKGKTDKGKGKGKEKGTKGKVPEEGGQSRGRPQERSTRGAHDRSASRVKRDDHGVPEVRKDGNGYRLNLCWWFQEKYNGGHKCPRKQIECNFIHQPCKDEAEFALLKVPRAETPPPVKKDDKGKGKGKPDAKAKAKAKAKEGGRAGSPGPKKT